MATENSTTVVQFETDTVEKFEATVVRFEDDTVKKFEVDTTTQEFLALTRIAMNYQRMEELLTECQHGDGNSLCLETDNKVSELLFELDMSLL
jgi:hypothetical protein